MMAPVARALALCSLLPLGLTTPLALTRQEPAAPPEVQHVYDLRDLLQQLSRAGEGPGSTLFQAPKDDATPEEVDAQRRGERAAVDAFLLALRHLLDAAKVAAPTAMAPTGQSVAIKASRETHRALFDLLSRFRETPPPNCLVEARLFRADAEAWKRAIEPALAKGRPVGRAGHQAVVLDKQPGEDFLAALPATEGVALVQAPRLLKAPLPAATIEVVEPISYIERFEVCVTPQGKIADPVVSVVKDGLAIAIGASLATPGGIAAELTATLTHVGRPIPTRRVKANLDGHETVVTIQEPKLTEARRQAMGVFPEGAPLFLPLTEPSGKRSLLVVRFTRG